LVRPGDGAAALSARHRRYASRSPRPGDEIAPKPGTHPGRSRSAATAASRPHGASRSNWGSPGAPGRGGGSLGEADGADAGAQAARGPVDPSRFQQQPGRGEEPECEAQQDRPTLSRPTDDGQPQPLRLGRNGVGSAVQRRDDEVMQPVWVLVHSPSVGPRTWQPVAERVQARGYESVVPSLLDVAEAGARSGLASSRT
jgi:hypothetical protein